MEKIIFKICLFLSLSTFAQTTNCLKQDTLNNYQSLKLLLTKQISTAQSILQGKKVEPHESIHIFGENFDSTKTLDYINQLKEKNASSTPIANEHYFITNCLANLKLTKELNELYEQARNSNNLKIQIYQNNELSNGLIKQGLQNQASLPISQKDITNDAKASEDQKIELEKDLIKTESKILNESNEQEREFASYKNNLTKIKLELVNLKIEQNKKLEDKLNYFLQKTDEVRSASVQSVENETAIKKAFENIEKIWLEITKENFHRLLKTDFTIKLPEIPQKPANIKQYNQKKADEITSLLEEINELITQTKTELSNKKEYELKILNELVIQVNSARSRIFHKLDGSFALSQIISLKGIQLIQNEVLASPYLLISFFYSKYFYIAEKISAGKQGYLALVADFFNILFFFLLFFCVNIVFKKFFTTLDEKHQQIVWKFKEYTIIKTIFIFWNKVKDNTINILWLFFIHYTKGTEYFSPIILILEIVEVFIAAKILESLVILFLSKISSIDQRNFGHFKEKAIQTATIFKNIFRVYFLSIIAVEATIGKVYVFTLVKTIIFIYSAYRLLTSASQWEEDLKHYMDKHFSGLITSKIYKLLNFIPQKFNAFVVLVLIIFLSVLNILIYITENFDISKKISANLFKKQIESVAAQAGSNEKIPQDYKELFAYNSSDDSNEYVSFNDEFEKEILVTINEWIDDLADEHSLVLYGDKGIGKTTLIKHTANNLMVEHKDKLDVIYTKLPSKSFTEISLKEFLVNELHLGMTHENFNLYDYDQSLSKKTIIIIDEAQNIFLSKTKSFEAYHLMVNLINLSTKNIFWYMSFNKYSWLYLDRAFGRTQFFRNIFELRGWSDTKIKELISKRHAASTFQLSYDLLINATRSQEEIDKYTSIEGKFFKLLWELSRGNPRAAIHLWLTALSRKNMKTFNVNIPREFDFEGIEKLSDDILFVLAAILKHENLKSSELEETTNLPKGIVRNSLKIALERKFIFRDQNSRYMIDIASQYGLIKHLKQKNFIYGN